MSLDQAESSFQTLELVYSFWIQGTYTAARTNQPTDADHVGLEGFEWLLKASVSQRE